MECDFCGCEPADPTTLRPVREVVMVPTEAPSPPYEVEALGDEHVACEDCYGEAFEPERLWRLEHECPQCWSFPCECEQMDAEDHDDLISRR
jgi:hypothetical protein